MSTQPRVVSEEEIRREVKRLIAEVTERNADEISDTALFADDLGIDSLMALEIVVAVDQKYKIQVPEEEFKKVTNVNDTVQLVHRCLNGNASTANA